MTDLRDRATMEMALGLAAEAAGRTSPNPCVGAVLVANGVIVGWGHHEAAGRPHAEAVALARAGNRAKGATLYVTLEPCVHWGRTPPCADAVIAAGVKRVVAAGLDPNPLVSSKGAAKLRRAGIPVEFGLLAERNARLNEHYLHYARGRKPFVTLKAAVSLDGKMAARTGEARWITGKETRAYAHLLRADNDAVMVGIGTVLRDDPLLSVRHSNWPGFTITRVVLDSMLRFPPRARMLADRKGGPVLIFASSRAPADKRSVLEKAGAEVVAVAEKNGALDLGATLTLLGRRDITGVLVEGGGRLATSFLNRRRAHKIVLMIAPIILGGADAVSFFGGAGFAAPGRALRLRKASSFRIGDDRIVEGYL